MSDLDVPPLVAGLVFLAFLVFSLTAVLEALGVLDDHVGSPDWHPGDPPNYRAYPCGDRRCRIDHDTVRPWVEPRNR